MDNKRILFVDDDPNVLQSFKRQLRTKFEIDTAGLAQEGLDLIKTKGPYALVVSDMRMPKVDGVSFLQQVEKLSADTVRIMLTGNADQDTAVRAVNEGHVFRFLNKPCSIEEFSEALNAGLAQYKLVTTERSLLSGTLAGSVKILTDILSMVDPSSFGRALDLRDSLRRALPAMGVRNLWEVELAALLASLGTVVLPSGLAEKVRNGQNLSPTESKLVAHVPETTRKLLSNIPRLERVAEIIYYLDKNFDGSGLPNERISGTDLPLESRALRIVRDLERLKSTKLTDRQALLELSKKITLYDENLFKILLKQANEPTEVKVIEERFNIPISDLCVGQRLLEDVLTTDGVLLVAAGAQVTELMFKRIENYAEYIGVQQPLVVDRRIPVAE